MRATGMPLLAAAAVMLSSAAAQDNGAFQLDQPAGAYQKDYRPAEGETVPVNPPPFIWVPPAQDLTYVLEVARNESFDNGVIRVEDIPVSTTALPATLPPGTWHWRYGVERSDDGVLWSRGRSFTVPQDAPAFPYPDVSSAIEMIPRERPRLMVPAPRLGEYRDRVASGDLQDLPGAYAGLDTHIGEELPPEPDYVTGTGPERGKNYQRIFRTTRPPMDRMESFAFSYLMTGNEAHGEEAKRRILHFFSWDPEGSTAYASNDEPAMWVMMRGVRAYDWTCGLFERSERKLVEDAMRVRAEQFYNHLRYRRRFHTNPYESHAGRTLGFLGEAAIAFAHEWDEAPAYLDYVNTLFWNVYPAWGHEDGGWHEGPGYYTAYMSFALHYAAALKEAAGLNLMAKPFFQNTPDFLLYTNPPYARISPFGDGESGASGRSRGRVMYWFSSLLGNPYARWYAVEAGADKGTGILDVVLRDDRVEAKPPTDLAQAKYFPGVGLVSLHTALGVAEDDVHFLIHSDPYGPISHAHADQNAFTLEAFGQPLAVASGYYPWYGSDHHRKWSWESKSSNTVTIDGGIGQVVRDPKSKGAIKAFVHGERFDYVEADATAAYQGRLTKFVRKVVHVRPGIFVIFDDLAAPKPVTFEWRLHSLSEMELDQPYQTVIVPQGDARLKVQPFHDENLEFTQTAGFDPPPEHGGADQYHLVISPPEKLETWQFITVVLTYKEGREDTTPTVRSVTSPTAEAVQLEDLEGLTLVAFRTDHSADSWGVELYESDGDVFAFHARPDGIYDHYLLHNGTRLVEAPPRGAAPTVIAK